MKDKIAILDFGGQYVHLIANKVRRLGVYSEIFLPTESADTFKDYKGIIFSGGPSSVYAEDRPDFNSDLINLTIPKLGICYGHQLINQQLGGTVEVGEVQEYGVSQLLVPKDPHPLLKNLPDSSPMWMSHGDKVSVPAEGFVTIASTDDCEQSAVANDTLKSYGIQFHPEVTHSEFGMKILENFIDICECAKDWDAASYIDEISNKIKAQVGDKNVLLLVSGGVDSTVAFVLLNNVLGQDRVIGVHIDNGLMRLNESAEVDIFLKDHNMHNLKIVDASDLFLGNLKGEFAPEAKRKIIGDTFLDVKDNEIEGMDLDPEQWIMAQGTIYPDTIESGGTKNADVIKTHHNRVPKVMELLEQGKVIEPLAELYKDEVRDLGAELDIPHALLWRHPFPGPGLGVRLLCSDGTHIENPHIEGLADYLLQNDIQGKILPIHSVGVQGDARTYAQPFVIQNEMGWRDCETYSTAITNRFKELNRLVYQVNSDPLIHYELVEQYSTRDRLDILRTIDAICTEFLLANNLYNEIWQMPVVLLPLTTNGKPVAVLRPVCSTEAMTANFYEMDRTLLNQLWTKVEAAGLGALLYDITHKPPGTIEWE
ncbi:MAG: glutamine-hydrolyzing GMP synthase [Fibrobacterales bacterium]